MLELNEDTFLKSKNTFMPVWRKQDADLTLERKADNLHRKLTIYIVNKLGYESNYEELSKLQKHERIKEVLETVSHRMGLGWENFDIEGMALSDVALAQNAKRWAKQSKIDVKHGENSLIHSLHALVDTLKIYNSALSDEQKSSFEFRNILIRTARSIKEHDRDENCGEDATVDSAARAKVDKDIHKAEKHEEPLKARFVRINNEMVARAIETRDFDSYFRAMDSFTSRYDLKETGAEPLEIFIKENANTKPETFAGKKFAEETTYQYLLAEGLHKGNDRLEKFIQYNVKGGENAQGTRHAIRFARLVQDPDFPERKIFSGETNDTILGQIEYIDRTPGKLAATAKGEVELAIAKEKISTMYETLGKILKMLPKFAKLNAKDVVSSQSELQEEHRQQAGQYIATTAVARKKAIEDLFNTDNNSALAKQVKRIIDNPGNVVMLKRLLEMAAREPSIRDDRWLENKTLSVEDVTHLSKLYTEAAKRVREGRFMPKEGEKLALMETQPFKVERNSFWSK